MFTKISFILAVSILFYWTACSKNTAYEGSEAPKTSIPAEDFVKQADELYSQRADFDKLREGIRILLRARTFYPDNFEIVWKISKYNYYLGAHSGNDDESEKAFKDGIDFARIATRLEPEKPDGFFWLAANLGGRAKESPLTKGLTSIKEIREAANKVIAIQPDYQGATAYDILGQVELRTRLFGFGGDAQRAVEVLETAMTLEKENAYIMLHLGEAYLAVKRREDAKRVLNQLLTMKPNPDYIPEYEDAAAQARKLLKVKFRN